MSSPMRTPLSLLFAAGLVLAPFAAAHKTLSPQFLQLRPLFLIQLGQYVSGQGAHQHDPLLGQVALSFGQGCQCVLVQLRCVQKVTQVFT